MLKTELEVGDTIRCADTKDMKAMATYLTKRGYEVESRGWSQIASNTLTITKVPEESE